MRPTILFFSLLLCASCSQLITPNVKTELSALKPGAYELDQEHTAVLFKVKHMGFSKFIGRFEQVQASLDFDPENMESARLHVIVEMNSLNVNNEAFESSLIGPGWLNVEEYPQAEFVADGVDGVEGNQLTFIGTLSFLGQENAVKVNATFNGGATNLLTQRYTVGFEAAAQFKRSDFGLTKYIPAVGDDIELEVHAEFQRK